MNSDERRVLGWQPSILVAGCQGFDIAPVWVSGSRRDISFNASPSRLERSVWTSWKKKEKTGQADGENQRSQGGLEIEGRMRELGEFFSDRGTTAGRLNEEHSQFAL